MKHNDDCELIQDLIPGYIDKVLSKTGTKAVEEHLENCEGCRKVYKEMQEGNEMEAFSKEQKALDGFRKVRQHIRIKGIIGIFFGLGLAAVLYVFFIHYIIGLPTVPDMISILDVDYHEEDQSLTIEGELSYFGFRISRVDWERDDAAKVVYMTVYEAETLPFYQGKRNFSITIPEMEDYTVYLESPRSIQREVYQWRWDYDHATLLFSLEEEIYASVPELDKERDVLSYFEIKEVEGKKGALYSVDHLFGEEVWHQYYFNKLVMHGDIKTGDFDLWISLEEPYQILVVDRKNGEYTQDTSVILDYKKALEDKEFIQ